MRCIDENSEPDHRIKEPTECLTCGAKPDSDADRSLYTEISFGNTFGDDAVVIVFTCGAVLYWHASLSATLVEGQPFQSTNYEKLCELRACPTATHNDQASQKAARIRSYLARRVGTSLDGEATDYIAEIIRQE